MHEIRQNLMFHFDELFLKSVNKRSTSNNENIQS